MDLALIASALYLSGQIFHKKRNPKPLQSRPISTQSPVEEQETQQSSDMEDPVLLAGRVPKDARIPTRKLYGYEQKTESEGFAPIPSDSLMAPATLGTTERQRIMRQLSTSRNYDTTQNTVIDTPLPLEAFRIKPKASKDLYGERAKMEEEWCRPNNGLVVETKAPKIAKPQFRAPRINKDLTHLTHKRDKKVGGEASRNAVDTLSLKNKILYDRKGVKKRIGENNDLVYSSAHTHKDKDTIEWQGLDHSRAQPKFVTKPDYSGMQDFPAPMPDTLDDYTVSWANQSQKHRVDLGEQVRACTKDEYMRARFGHAKGRKAKLNDREIDYQLRPKTRKEELAHSGRTVVKHRKHKHGNLNEYQMRDTKKEDRFIGRNGLRSRRKKGTTDERESVELKSTRHHGTLHEKIGGRAAIYGKSAYQQGSLSIGKSKEIEARSPVSAGNRMDFHGMIPNTESRKREFAMRDPMATRFLDQQRPDTSNWKTDSRIKRN